MRFSCFLDTSLHQQELIFWEAGFDHELQDVEVDQKLRHHQKTSEAANYNLLDPQARQR